MGPWGAMGTRFVAEFVYVFLFLFLPKTCSRRARRGLKRSLEAVGFVLAEFQPKRSHGDPIRDIFRVNFQDAISRNIIDGGKWFSKRECTHPLDPSRKMRSKIPHLLAR